MQWAKINAEANPFFTPGTHHVQGPRVSGELGTEVLSWFKCPRDICYVPWVVLRSRASLTCSWMPPPGGGSSCGGKSPSMAGPTASMRQLGAALRDPRVAAIWAACSVVLAAAVVMSYPVVERRPS